MMSKRNIADLLVLGYSDIWLDAGILSLEKLDEQLLEFKDGTDSNAEHYRYRTLIAYFQSRDRISDTELNNLLMVVSCETDKVVAGAALGSLLAKDYLTSKQFDITVAALSEYGNWTMNVIRRYSLIRQLKSSQLTNEIFENCINDGDKVVHNLLLGIIFRDNTRLSRLAEKGANREIRNRASQLLKKKNYR